jgi:hypothetical protein
MTGFTCQNVKLIVEIRVHSVTSSILASWYNAPNREILFLIPLVRRTNTVYLDTFTDNIPLFGAPLSWDLICVTDAMDHYE